MVAADFALLSFAVLSAIGLGSARGDARFARYRQRIAERDETEIAYGTLVSTTDSTTSIPVVSSTPKPPPRGPSKVASEDGNASVTTTLDLGHAAPNQDGESGSSTLSSSSSSGMDVTSLSKVAGTTYNTLRTETDLVTSIPTAASTVKPPSRPGKTSVAEAVTISLDLGNQAASSEIVNAEGSTVLSTIGMKATYSLPYSSSSSSSTATDYIYPGEYGAGGTLTTDSNAPTRTVEPSRSSVIPSSSSRIGPPPADTSVFTSSKKPPARPTKTLATSTSDDVADPTTSATDDGFSYLPGHDFGSTTISPSTTKKTSPPTRPAVIKTTGTASIRSSLITLDFGHTPTTDATSVVTPTSNPFGNSSYWGNSTISGLTTATALLQTSWSYTISESLTTDARGSTVSVCQPTDSLKPSTTYSVVYTSTITWYGNPDDYTPPYGPISTPEPCLPPKTPLRLTMSYCSATGTATGTELSKYMTCLTSTTELIYTTAGPGFIGPPTITFVTTDKNPTVVYSTIETPDYGVSQPAGTRDQVVHSSPTTAPDPVVSTPAYASYQSQVAGNSEATEASGNTAGVSLKSVNDPAATGGNNAGTTPINAGHASATQPITVGVQPTAVVIDGTTITDNAKTPTQTVTVDGQTFTIDPTQVVGVGQTINRPAATGGVYVPTPTSTQIQGVPVTVSSSVAVIGGTTFTLGPTATTAIVSGQTVTVGPSGVVVASTTIPVISNPSPTQVVVEGGDLITAIGPSVVVIHGTTITYGPGISASTTVVDDDTITIGPSGVTVHGTTLGGPTARSSETQYEIVGGATITQIGPSVVVINNTTYTVGPGSGTTTTVIGHETITIGPSGIAVSTYSISYPFGPTTTITPAATGVIGTASPTASKNAGPVLRPGWTWVSFVSCIVIGVLELAF